MAIDVAIVFSVAHMSTCPDRNAVFDVVSSSNRTMFAFGAMAVKVRSWVVPLVAEMRRVPS